MKNIILDDSPTDNLYLKDVEDIDLKRHVFVLIDNRDIKDNVYILTHESPGFIFRNTTKITFGGEPVAVFQGLNGYHPTISVALNSLKSIANSVRIVMCNTYKEASKLF